jgi:enamine deaminase RidA (YjgF/YER057c/UK114 family)
MRAEERLVSAGIQLPPPVTPFGAYVPAVQTGSLLFLTGMLPTVGHEPKFLGRVGKELNTDQGVKAAYAAALNVLAVARQHLGSLDRVSRVVRLGVYIATAGDVDQVRIADSASELLREVFGEDKISSRLVFGVERLPLGVPIELEAIFEVIAKKPGSDSVKTWKPRFPREFASRARSTRIGAHASLLRDDGRYAAIQ